ncbi:hypothetical protein ACFOMH_06560 [Paracoccus mangrovi]|uniref:Uncharacterized protein n=1 Tax=Paracoccus mangrovi TaxID=1715645 RepID=A0ABV7R3E9_9RHOB
MIDYIDLLNKSCPEEVVEYVLAADPATIPAMLWPNNDPFGSDYDNACHSAVIGYYSRGIGPNSSWDWDTAYVQDFMDVVLTGDILKKDERAPDEVRQAFARALERLAATDKPLPGGYYNALRHFNLDYRRQLLARYPVPPSPQQVLDEQSDQAYALYLARYQEPGSLERLDQAVALAKGPSAALNLLNEIFRQKIPGAERIFVKYKDDARATSDVCGNPGLAVMDRARLYIGLPRSKAPRIHMDENGQPIPFETTPKGRAAAKGQDYSCRG